MESSTAQRNAAPAPVIGGIYTERRRAFPRSYQVTGFNDCTVIAEPMPHKAWREYLDRDAFFDNFDGPAEGGAI